MLTSDSKCILEAIFCLQKMNEGSHYHDEQGVDDSLFEEMNGLKANHKNKVVISEKKRKESKESKYSNYSNNNNSLESGNGISEFSIDEIKDIQEELDEAITLKKENDCNEKENCASITNNSTLFHSLNYSLKKDESLIQDIEKEKDKDSKFTSNFLENFEFEYVDSYLNKSQNYNYYVNNVMKSLIKLSKLNLTKEISKKLFILPETNKIHTVLLDLDETLIHSDFEFNENESDDHQVETKILSFYDKDVGENVKFKVYLRPGIRNFLEEVSKYFQIGIFTASIKEYADEVLNFLDPENKLFSFKCYRDSCIKVGRSYIKDLRIFKNRKLENLLIIDNNLYSFSNQLSNGILIDSFYDEAHDNELNNILSFLVEYISKCNDVKYVNEQVFRFQELFEQTKLEKIIKDY